MSQLALFGQSQHLSAEKLKKNADSLNRAELGTFKDSLRAPVHRWFTYPAGFSYKAVEEAFRHYQIKPGMTVYDPFVGTGTTCVVAKQKGINSFGVEAHPFIQFVAQTKLFWQFQPKELHSEIEKLISQIQKSEMQEVISRISVEQLFPELVCKCYSRDKLARLYTCREAVKALPPTAFRDFARLGLTNLLRLVSDVAAGWPYVAPQKPKSSSRSNGNSVRVSEAFRKLLYQMAEDVQTMLQTTLPGARSVLIPGDSRLPQKSIAASSINLAFTSPPYLNNYDYADRTRLETYFWGEARTWADITELVRTRLIMSATTQINRSDFDEANLLSEEFCQTVPHLAEELEPKVVELSERRLTKGGKKSYDINNAVDIF